MNTAKILAFVGSARKDSFKVLMNDYIAKQSPLAVKLLGNTVKRSKR